MELSTITAMTLVEMITPERESIKKKTTKGYVFEAENETGKPWCCWVNGRDLPFFIKFSKMFRIRYNDTVHADGLKDEEFGDRIALLEKKVGQIWNRLMIPKSKPKKTK